MPKPELPAYLPWDSNVQLDTRIDDANATLAAIQPGKKPRTELANAIEQGLADPWEYTEDMCAFSGLCQTATYYKNGYHETASSLRFVDNELAMSVGVRVMEFGNPGYEHWAVGFMFEDPRQVADDGQPAEIEHYLHSRAPYNIVSAGEVDSANKANLLFPDTAENVLMNHSRTIAKLQTSPKFLRSSQQRQQAILVEAVTKAAVDTTAVEPILSQPVQFSCANAYRYDYKDGNYQYIPVDIDETDLEGRVQDITTLGLRRILSGRPVRKLDHYVDGEVGLYLDIQLNTWSAKTLGLRHGTHLYVSVDGLSELEIGAIV